MAGRDLFAHRSPQFLQRIGSNSPKVKEWTLMEKMQGSQNTPQGTFKDAQGNEYDTASGQMLKPLTYKTPDALAAEQNAIADQQAAIQARHAKAMELVDSGKQLVNDAYAGGKALVNDASVAGADAMNRFLSVDQSVADEEDKLKR